MRAGHSAGAVVHDPGAGALAHPPPAGGRVGGDPG